MKICQSCDKRHNCRVPSDFARFQRVYEHLEAHGGPEFLRQRLKVFLHINHCIAEGELDLIHNLVNDHMTHDVVSTAKANAWGIPEEARLRMIKMGRQLA